MVQTSPFTNVLPLHNFPHIVTVLSTNHKSYQERRRRYWNVPYYAGWAQESFSKLDLSQSYKQMKVEKSSQSLLTIDTHLGLYWYARLPFRISTAPALWQKAVAQVLQGIPGGCIVYWWHIDYRLHKSGAWSKLAENLGRITEYGLQLKKSKCLFFQKELEFLGHLTSQDGIKTTQNQIEGVKAAPTPRNK